MRRRRAVLAGVALWLSVALWPDIARAQAYDFALRDGAGRTVTPAQFRGKFLLVFFGYTRCPDVCPATLQRMAQAMAEIDPRGVKFAAVFISLDAAHDSPAVVARYAALFSPHIEGLCGSVDEVAQAARAFHVYVAWPQGPDGPLTHSALLYVLGPQGGLNTVLPGGLSTAQLAQALARCLSR